MCMKFDMLHCVAPMTAPDVIRKSPLANKEVSVCVCFSVCVCVLLCLDGQACVCVCLWFVGLGNHSS
jgi:hypothetical protein